MKEIPHGGEEPIIQRPSEPEKAPEGTEQRKRTESYQPPSGATPEVIAPIEVLENLQTDDPDQTETRTQSSSVEQPRRYRRGFKFPGLQLSSGPEHDDPKASQS